MDAIPWQFDLTAPVVERLKRYYGTEDVLGATGDHIVLVGPGRPRGAVEEDPGPGRVCDEFGAVWHHTPDGLIAGDVGALVSSPVKAPTLAGYEFPDGAAPGRWDHIPELRRTDPDRFLMTIGFGLFEPAWAMCGFQNYLAYLAGEPKFVGELTERLADFSCQVTGQLAGMEVDGIRFGDDWGFQDRLMMRVETWRRLLKPNYRRIYQAAHDAGLVVLIHSCGNITELLPDLIEIGVQVVHPLQPEAMDVAGCQREFGKDLTFWGGLGSQSTIPLGSPEDNAREARERLRLFRDGHYILAPAGATPTETPAENIAAIVEVARSQLRQ